MSILSMIMSESGRRWLYGVGVAVAALAIGYGALSADQAALWLGLLTALLGGTALTHVGARGLDEPRRATPEE